MKRMTRLWLNVLLPPLLIVLSMLLLPKIVVFFFPFVLGWIISVLARPLIRFLDQKTRIMRKQHASASILVLLLGLIALFVYAAILFLIRIFRELSYFLPTLYQELSGELRAFIEVQEGMSGKIPALLTAGIRDVVENFDSYFSELIGRLSTPAVSASLGLVKSLPVALVYLVVTIFSAYSFCKDGEQYKEWLLRLCPKKLYDYGHRLREDIERIFHGWLLAQLRIMVLIFLLLCAGFLLMKVPYAPLIALLTAFLDFLPMFGVGFIMWPWILAELFFMNFRRAAELAVLYVLTQAVRQFLQPKIMGDTLGLPPMLSILSLYLGFKIYGFAGMIFAIPAGMLFLTLYRYGAFDKMLDSLRELYEELLQFL